MTFTNMSNNSSPTAGIRVVVDSDKRVGFENNNLLKKVINILLIPVLNSLPITSRSLIKKTHRSANELIVNITTHKALEVLYNDGYPEYAKTLLSKFFHFIWFYTNNAKAVRNRLKIVKREIIDEINLLIDKGIKDIYILSIASGSARAIIESLQSINNDQVNFFVSFLDKSPEALNYSEDLFSQTQLNKKLNIKIEWINDTVRTFLRQDNKKYNIVEIVGLMDYFDDEKVIETFSLIKNRLHDGGILLTANIHNNSERPFITRVVGWDMVYRTAEELAILCIKSGFRTEDLCVLYEPLKIHTVIKARK